MLVYRVCTQNEVNRILQNEPFSTIGCLGEDFIKYQQTRAINNHKYKSDKLYLPFFDDIWSITYWKATKGNYVCTYDIPDDILVNCFGTGKYLNSGSESEIANSVSEYAVESDKIKKQYLIRVELIKANIDLTDDDYIETLEDYLEVIYETSSQRPQYKRKQFSSEEIKQLLKSLYGKKTN